MRAASMPSTEVPLMSPMMCMGIFGNFWEFVMMREGDLGWGAGGFE